MIENVQNEKLFLFKKDLSNCVNVTCKTFYNKELILNFNNLSKQIGFITYGKATIIKSDINGNKIILRELKENDIFSNLFYQNFADEIYIFSNSNITEVNFINYYAIIKNCNMNCPFHNKLVLNLFDLVIKDNKELNDKIELLSQKTVEDKILYFLKKRMKNNLFKVTTSYKAISDYISVDRSNFMRELNKLEKKGIIKKEGKQITILK